MEGLISNLVDRYSVKQILEALVRYCLTESFTAYNNYEDVPYGDVCNEVGLAINDVAKNCTI